MRPFFGIPPRRPSRRALVIGIGIKALQSGAVYLYFWLF
jgi:hypothetical protein